MGDLGGVRTACLDVPTGNRLVKNLDAIGGFKRFQQQYFGDDRRLYASMKEGQPAKTLMIACCDSRVDPAILMDCDPGDLFIVRNVANSVPPWESAGHYHVTSAALEFAVLTICK